MKAYKRILVPTDGTDLSLEAAQRAASLAKVYGAELTAVHVVPHWTPIPHVGGGGMPAEVFDENAFNAATEATSRAALDKVKAAADGANVRFSAFTVRHDQPWRGIVETANDKQCDLIVMASHCRTGLDAILLGSETRQVLSHASQPVLVCRGGHA